MAKKVYDEDNLNMRNTNWDGDDNTGGIPVSGRLVENYIKGIDDKTETTDEIAKGETKPPTSDAVFNSVVGAVTDIDVQDSEDGTQYVMSVKQKGEDGGETTKEVRFSKYSDDDKVVVNIDMSDGTGAELPATQYLPLGSGIVVKYAANVGTVGGSEVSGFSDLKTRVIMKRGSTVLSDFQNAEFVSVSAGRTYTFDSTKYLTDATTYAIQIEAQATYQGQLLTRTATVRVTMVAIDLKTTYSVANGVSNGGYKNDVNIPFTVKGTTGEKNIYYRINGGTPYTIGLSSGSGTQSKNVTIPLSSIKGGLNVVEAYALHESSGVISEVHYINILKASSDVKSYAGLMFSNKADGFQKDWRTPVLRAEQFTAWNFDYTGYDADNNIAFVKVLNGSTIVKEDRIPRGVKGSYGKTNVSVEPQSYTLECGETKLTIKVETAGHADIEATLSADAVCTFDAFGRSNTENNAASWISGDMFMEFNNVLWNVNENGAGSGWYKDRLLLSNGASMELTAEGGYRPFNDAEKPTGFSINDVGMTIEIEYSTANVTDTNAELITCLGKLSNGNRYGLVITAEEAKFLTGVVTEAPDGDEIITYEDSVGTKFEPGTNIKITYVFYPNVQTNEQRGLIGFFVNGEESAASKWLNKVNFDIEEQLKFTSKGADLFIKNIRIYNKALTDDEVLNNYIVDRNHLEDTDTEKGVRSLDEENRVLDEGQKVSFDKLMALMQNRKNSVLVMIGSGSVGSEVPSDSDTLNVVDALAQLNDKKANKLIQELRFYNGENHDLDFIARNIYGRIQGTSSVNYARKNFRFYFQKPEDKAQLSYGEIDGNGNQSNPTETTGKKNLFRLRPNSIGAKLACPKCDFSDSSMTTNTGGAKFIHDGLKEMGILTPAQRYAKDHALNDDVRSAIDGMPCDLFVAKSIDEDFTYYGQYNMNNEKSDSYPIFGQDKTIGGVTWGTGDTLNYLEPDTEGSLGTAGAKNYLPICFETLNNSNPCCLFQWVPSTDSNHTDFMDNNFDSGLEFNHPKDTFWKDGKGDEKEEPNLKDHIGTGDKYDKMYKATDRMMSFINRCVKETEAGKNMKYNPMTHLFEGVDYEDDGNKFPSAKWKSETFRKEASKYFNIPYFIVYYLYVDFDLGVDQLAKNMLLRTWDGLIWYVTYYDGDCQLGSDNKSFLTGKYDDNRQTKNDSGAYVMQGHNSWLWNLILANFRDMMEEIMTKGYNGGTSFMSAFSIQKAIDHFDKEQMEKWCSRLYSKSGIFKYIYPFLNPMKVGANGTLKTYAQIYGLKGSLKAHRNYFIRRRYDLKQVEYGYVSTLGARLYQSTTSLDRGYILKPMQFELIIPYRVQLKTVNYVEADSGVVEANTLYSLQLPRAYGENDPLTIIGAEKIKKLIWHEDAFAIDFEFGLLTSLVELDMSVTSQSTYRNGSFMSSTDSLLLLEVLNMRNNMLARNGDSGSVATLDLNRQARLRKIDVRGTGLTKLILATGAPLEEAYLPEALEELFLEHLPKLQESGLHIGSINKIIGYRFANCPGIDGFAILENLHAAKVRGDGKLERFRYEIDTTDDGTLLEKYYNYKSYTSTGANDNNHSGLVGKVRLTQYLNEVDLARYREKYPELEFILPEYTMLEFDDEVSDDANVSNLDNHTGCKYKNKYEPSAHILEILKKRHRVLSKLTKRPTSRNMVIGGQEVPVNNTDGVMTYYPLHDSDSNFYADAQDVKDCTPAKLDGTEGDWDILEPFFWFKGINDYLNKKHYACYSSKGENDMPAVPDATVMTLDDIKRTENGYLPSRKILVERNTLEDSYSSDTKFSVCKVNVSGFKRVRFPSVPGSAFVGSIFTDSNKKVIKSINVPTIGSGFEAGMYLIVDVPSNAMELHFSILNTAEFDKVVLSNSDKIEDMEPDWVASEEHLCAVVESSVVGSKLRACITRGASTGSMNWVDFHYYSQQRGRQQIDALMHFRIANLFYAKYGRRDAQDQCGAGQHSYTRIIGGSAAYGMTDTIGFKEAYKIDNKVTNSIGDGIINQYAWYKVKDEYGKDIVTQVNNTSCLGYESTFGDKAEWMDGVDLPNDSGNVGKWRIIMPDGSIRRVQGSTTSDFWIGAIAHGKHMDIIPTGNLVSSNSTYYCDKYWMSTSTHRVVYRSNYFAYAFGGVSYAVAAYDSSYARAHIGSRLAFRGKIVKAESVRAFKAINALA